MERHNPEKALNLQSKYYSMSRNRYTKHNKKPKNHDD